jgi:hypothetical protein
MRKSKLKYQGAIRFDLAGVEARDLLQATVRNVKDHLHAYEDSMKGQMPNYIPVRAKDYGIMERYLRKLLKLPTLTGLVIGFRHAVLVAYEEKK